MNRVAARLLAAVALTTAGGIAGCGGGDDAGISRAEYIARADEVCATLREQVNALPFASDDPNQVALAFREGARLGDEQVRQLREIEPPREDEDDIDAILDLADRLNGVGRQAADALAAGNDVRFRELITESRNITRRQRELALQYGFRACAGRP